MVCARLHAAACKRMLCGCWAALPGNSRNWSESGFRMKLLINNDSFVLFCWQYVRPIVRERPMPAYLLNSLCTAWCKVIFPLHFFNRASSSDHRQQDSPRALDKMVHCFSLFHTARLQDSRGLPGLLFPSGSHGRLVSVKLPGLWRQCPRNFHSLISASFARTIITRTNINAIALAEVSVMLFEMNSG